MRATTLSLTICATFILLANAEQSRNVNTPEIKDQMQKRAIVVYEVEPQGTNRNTDDNLNLPPEDPNAQNSPQNPASGAPPAENAAAPPGGSSQSGGFGDRKKKDHKEVQTPPVAADQGKDPKQDAKKEETPAKNLKDGDKKEKEEKKEETVTEKPKKNEGSEEKENNEEDAKEEVTNEEEQEEEEDEEDDDEEENEEEEEDNDEEEEEEDVKDQAAQGMAADAQYSQIGNTWFAEEENSAAEKELTFRPASLSPEKTASGDKPQSSTFKSRQGVEKIIDTPDVSGASKRTAMAVTLSGAAIVGSLFFSL